MRASKTLLIHKEACERTLASLPTLAENTRNAKMLMRETGIVIITYEGYAGGPSILHEEKPWNP